MELLVEKATGDLDLQRARVMNYVMAALFAHRLDAQLAQGAQPEASVELALRSQLLVRPSLRRRLATSLRQLLAVAEGTVAAPPSAVPLSRTRIQQAADDIRELIEELLAQRPVGAQGVAKTCVLLSDGCGPLYCSWSAESVEELVREALTSLN